MILAWLYEKWINTKARLVGGERIESAGLITTIRKELEVRREWKRYRREVEATAKALDEWWT